MDNTPQDNLLNTEVADQQMQQEVLETLPPQEKPSLSQKIKEQLQSFSFFFKNLKIKVPSFFSQKRLTASERVNMPTLKKEISGEMNFFHYFMIGKKDMIALIEQLSTLLSSGIRLVDSLIIIKQQVESSSMKRLIIAITEDVKGGAMLSQAIEKHPKLFPTKWVSLVRAGEKSGQLEQILLDLSEDELEQQKLASALKGAMAYPVFVIVLTIALVTYMLIVVVPEISEIYAKMHQKLPAPTIFVIALSEFLQESYVFILSGIIMFITAIKTSAHFFYRVRDILDWIKLHIPVLGSLRQKQNIAMFAGNLALLLQSGVLVVDALTIVTDILPSPLYKKQIRKIIEGVKQGRHISQEMGLINLQKEQFERNFYFPLSVSQMVHIGEETGTLAPLLEKMKRNYVNQINLTVKTFSSLLEPFMIIIVGILVGGILMAVILPFFSMKV